MAENPIHPTDLVGTRPVFLLDVEYAGRTWRTATEAVDVKDAAGEWHSYAPGLDTPRFEQTLGRLELDPGEATASFAVVLEGADIAALRREGHDLQRARATLWMVAVRIADAAVGAAQAVQTMEERWWLLDGQLVDPHYSEPGQPAGWLSATIQEDPWIPSRESGAGRLMSGSDQLTVEAFPDIQNASIGKYAPIVIGQPGWFPLPPGYPTAGSLTGPPKSAHGGGTPAYSADSGSAAHGGAFIAPLLVCREQVAATSVVIFQVNSGSPPESRDIAYMVDANGRSWPVIEMSGSSGLTDGTDPYYATWFTGGGGIFDPLLGGTLENAASVVAWALNTAGHRIDVRRWIAAIDRLPVIKVAGYINDPEATAWAWLEDNILPLLPLTVARGRDGLRPIIYDPHLRTDEVVAHLVEGEDWHRADRVQTARERDDSVTTVQWNFADGLVYGEPMQYVRFSVDPGTDYDEHTTLYNRVSVARYGESPQIETIDQPFLWDRESAAASLRRMLRLRTMPLEVTSYRAPWHLGWLEVGHAIANTDAAARWDDALAVVSGKWWDGDAWVFEVTLDEDMVRDARRVP